MALVHFVPCSRLALILIFAILSQPSWSSKGFLYLYLCIVHLRICAFVQLYFCVFVRMYINLCNSIQVQPVLKRPRPSIVALPFYPSTNAPSMFFDSMALFEIDLEPFNAFNLYLHTPKGKVETVERKEAETMLMQFPI